VTDHDYAALILFVASIPCQPKIRRSRQSHQSGKWQTTDDGDWFDRTRGDGLS